MLTQLGHRISLELVTSDLSQEEQSPKLFKLFNISFILTHQALDQWLGVLKRPQSQQWP